MKERDSYNISFLVPVLGYKSVGNIIESLEAQKIVHYEILILRNGISDLPDGIKIWEQFYTKGRQLTLPIREVLIRERGKGNALNIGLAKAVYEIVCVLDADCKLLPGAIDIMLKHFETTETIAVGGCLQVDNSQSCFLAQLQRFEYMRVFGVVRPIYAWMGAQCLISGAWGMFRKENLLLVGGYDTHTVGEDMEMTLRLQNHSLRSGKKQLAYARNALCATKVPQSLAQLLRQRDRWQRGLLDSLLKHWYMIGNPNYGLLGMVVLPYQLVVELLGPLLLALYVLNSNFRSVVNGHIAIYVVYAFYEISITFYAAFLIMGKNIKKFLKWIPKLLVLSLADMVLKLLLACARLYGMATFWWRRTEW